MEISGKRVLVTGGSGCIGESVCEFLSLYHPRDIVVVGRKKSQLKDGGIVKYISGDICDFDFMEELIKNNDILIHLAAKVHYMPNSKNEEEEFYKVNTHASEHIFRLAQKYDVKKVIFVSTVAVFGKTGNEKVTEDSCCKPDTAYGNSKLLAEQILLKLCSENSLRATILRPTTVFGRKDVGNVANLIKLLKKGIGIVISEGKNQKSFIYSKDIGSAIIESIKNDNTNGKVYIVSGFDLKVQELIENVKDIFNIKACTLSIPLFIIKIVKLFNKVIYSKLKTLGSTNLYDGSKFCKETGFKCQYNFKSGLSDSLDYYDRL